MNGWGGSPAPKMHEYVEEHNLHVLLLLCFIIGNIHSSLAFGRIAWVCEYEGNVSMFVNTMNLPVDL